MRQLFLAFAIGASLSVSIPASALTIDDFSGPLQWVNGCCSAGLEEAHPVLGGARYLNAGGDIYGVSAIVGEGTFTAQSNPPSGRGAAGTWYDGVVDGIAGFPGNLDIDLTDSGAADRFRVEVLFVSGIVAIQVGVVDGSGATRSLSSSPVSPGIVDFLFSDPAFSFVDFTDIQSISLRTSTLYHGEHVVLGDFSTVPEPATASLLALGLVGLAAQKRIGRV